MVVIHVAILHHDKQSRPGQRASCITSTSMSKGVSRREWSPETEVDLILVSSVPDVILERGSKRFTGRLQITIDHLFFSSPELELWVRS